jgi:hypothetical protein
MQTLRGYHARLGPALILLQGAGSATLEYVRGSTELVDEHGRTLTADLADGVTRRNISLPYDVPGGAAYFLHFRVRIKARQAVLRSSGHSRQSRAERADV